MTARHEAPATRVTIVRDGVWFVVSDEHGEFARTTSIPFALRYAEDLLYGPGTGVLSEHLGSPVAAAGSASFQPKVDCRCSPDPEEGHG